MDFTSRLSTHYHHCFADNSSDIEPEAVDPTYATMNGHSWSSLVTNKDSPIEFYFASDARYICNKRA